ncbi:MAG: hypothetical protein GY934_09755 [Gammaproteobacteria bacterium]|nr:hypothetical protein [Gammaproteobacteria bacterium]
MQKLEQPRPDVGDIVARFQCHELHPGYKDVIFSDHLPGRGTHPWDSQQPSLFKILWETM